MVGLSGIFPTILFILFAVLFLSVHGTETVIFDRILSDHRMDLDLTRVLQQALTEVKDVRMGIHSNNPIAYRLKKCGRVLLSTQEPVVNQKLVLNEIWNAWFMNETQTNCKNRYEQNQFQLDILTNVNTSGAITFKVVGRAESPIVSDLFKNFTPYYIASQAHETTMFNVTLSSDFKEAISSGYKSMHFIADLTSPGRVDFGKCGMMIPNSIYLKGKDDIVLKNTQLEAIIRLANLRCSSDSTLNRFEVRVTIFKAGSGSFAIRMMEDTPSKEEIFYFALAVIFALSILTYVVCIIVCLMRCKCCKKKKDSAHDWSNMIAMQQRAGQCDTCGEPIHEGQHQS